MKIAYLSPEYPHEKTGHSAGLGSSIKNLVQALVCAGHEITVFVYSQKSHEIFDDNGVTIHKIENKAARIADVIHMTGLEKEQNKIIGTLSKGYRQRVGLAQAIIQHFKHFEIQHIVISPGSRNAPLTLSFGYDDYFKCYSIPDERSAAFFALGMSQKLQKPPKFKESVARPFNTFKKIVAFSAKL